MGRFSALPSRASSCNRPPPNALRTGRNARSTDSDEVVVVASEDDRWLDKPAVARRYRVTEHWVHRNAARLPHIRVGKFMRFDRDELDEWFRQGRLARTGGPARLSLHQGRRVAASAPQKTPRRLR